MNSNSYKSKWEKSSKKKKEKWSKQSSYRLQRRKRTGRWRNGVGIRNDCSGPSSPARRAQCDFHHGERQSSKSGGDKGKQSKCFYSLSLFKNLSPFVLHIGGLASLRRLRHRLRNTLFWIDLGIAYWGKSCIIYFRMLSSTPKWKALCQLFLITRKASSTHNLGRTTSISLYTYDILSL